MSKSPIEELQKTKEEVERLVKNRGAFTEILPDMILLVREDFIIEDMNQSAISVFGYKRGQVCHQALHHADQPCMVCPVKYIGQGLPERELLEMKIGDMYVECSYAPFQGYRGDKLVLIAMRDISRRKRHEEEIKRFHTNIETVLHQKIKELKESEKVRQQLTQEMNVLKGRLKEFGGPGEMVGSSRRIAELRNLIHRVADSEATILVTGESGTGKELVADLIHRQSSRRDKPFLKFNCAAVSESLLESDLFGHEKGSFTGAESRKKGKFETAAGATIFLDEIGDISPRMQAAILRVLQNGEIIRVGGNEPIKVNARIIAATNVDLAKAVEEGRFRKDLYYRLNVINLHLPSLRERKEDIPMLAGHFVRKYRRLLKRDVEVVSEKAIEKLLLHDWPGNIRELENVIQRAVLLAGGKIIDQQEISYDSGISDFSRVVSQASDVLERPLKDTLADLEKKILQKALQRCNGKAQEVAKTLGMGKTAIYEKIKRYGLSGAL